MKKILDVDLFGKAGARITLLNEDTDTPTYELRWTDYVINEWHEEYAELSLAIIRLGVLADCIGNDTSFEHTREDFLEQGMNFLFQEINVHP